MISETPTPLPSPCSEAFFMFGHVDIFIICPPSVMQEQLQTGFGDWQQACGPSYPPLAATEGPWTEDKGLSGSLPRQTGGACRVSAGRCHQWHLSPGCEHIAHTHFLVLKISNSIKGKRGYALLLLCVHSMKSWWKVSRRITRSVSSWGLQASPQQKSEE